MNKCYIEIQNTVKVRKSTKRNLSQRNERLVFNNYRNKNSILEIRKEIKRAYEF